MILSENNENDLFVDDDLVNCSEKCLSDSLNKIADNSLQICNHYERLSKSLFRAAYVLGNQLQLSRFNSFIRQKIKYTHQYNLQYKVCYMIMAGYHLFSDKLYLLIT